MQRFSPEGDIKLLPTEQWFDDDSFEDTIFTSQLPL